MSLRACFEEPHVEAHIFREVFDRPRSFGGQLSTSGATKRRMSFVDFGFFFFLHTLVFSTLAATEKCDAAPKVTMKQSDTGEMTAGRRSLKPGWRLTKLPYLTRCEREHVALSFAARTCCPVIFWQPPGATQGATLSSAFIRLHYESATLRQ